jgi:hypothetical protein
MKPAFGQLAAVLSLSLALGMPLSAARGADEGEKSAPAKQLPVASSFDVFKANVYSLNLTDDQKKKVDGFFDKAQTDLKAAQTDSDQKAGKQRIHEITQKLFKDVAATLTAEQNAQLKKKMQPAPPDYAATIDHIKAELSKPEAKLTDDQRTQAFAVLDDTKQKLQDLEAKAKASGADVAPKVKVVLADMNAKLKKILAESH